MLFILLSVIWGSSFILMKIGLQNELSAYQVAALRMTSAGIVLLPFSVRSFYAIPKEKWGFVLLSGLLGSFIPAFLFCIAETKIDSGLAGILNALTPLFTILIGIFFFQVAVNWLKILGIVIGFLGLALLPFAGGEDVSTSNVGYAFLIVLATICYGLNVNLVGRFLKQQSSLHIVSLAFSFILVPGVIILIATGYFQTDFTTDNLLKGTGASVLLGIFGTALAGVLFYKLLQMAGPLFGSLVTYGMPFVAIGWAIVFNEEVSIWQFGCLILILIGVYVVSFKKNTSEL